MATLNSSNITNGNTVEPNDLLQLYDAFKSGGGTTGAYSVSISGSITGSASTATSASFAISSSRAVSSSFATTAISSSYSATALSSSFAVSSSRAISSSFATTAGSSTSSSLATNAQNIDITDNQSYGGVPYYPTFVGQTTGYTNVLIDSVTFTYNPNTNTLTTTSSFSVSASYAANGGTSNQIIQQQSERLSGGVQDSTFKFICGSALASGGVATTSAYSLLSGKTLGTNVFVTATINSSSAAAGNTVVVKALAGGSLTFNTAGGTGTETIFYQAFILQ